VDEPRKAVSVDVGVARLAALSVGRMGASSMTRGGLCVRLLGRIRALRRSVSRRRQSRSRLKAKRKLAKEHECEKGFRWDPI